MVTTPLVQSFLKVDTPQAWLEEARLNIELLLIDQANCEKKAASTAVSMLYRYVEYPRLLRILSRVAREELRHFELVVRLLERRSLKYHQLPAAQYARGLHRWIRTHEPAKMVDTLLVNGMIEARSCERIEKLIPVLDSELQKLYSRLYESEGRHFNLYLDLVYELADVDEIESRMYELRKLEETLVIAVDPEFRFHSGIPRAAEVS